jgi:hypothetical protein
MPLFVCTTTGRGVGEGLTTSSNSATRLDNSSASDRDTTSTPSIPPWLKWARTSSYLAAAAAMFVGGHTCPRGGGGW